VKLARALEPLDMVLLEEAIARAHADGRTAVLFYFADFDPSGHQMSMKRILFLPTRRNRVAVATPFIPAH
jgi:hypothetical protein